MNMRVYLTSPSPLNQMSTSISLALLSSLPSSKQKLPSSIVDSYMFHLMTSISSLSILSTVIDHWLSKISPLILLFIQIIKQLNNFYNILFSNVYKNIRFINTKIIKNLWLGSKLIMLSLIISWATNWKSSLKML